MTGERAKRFPLGLEDLVREPRRAEGRPGDLRAASIAAGKSSLANPSQTAARNAGQTAARNASQAASQSNGKAANPVAGKPAGKSGVPSGTKPVGTAGAALKPSVAQKSVAASSSSHGKPKSGAASLASERSTAPNVALNTSHALTSERVRERMVERLRANGVTDSRVLHAMSAVPRHMFVDPGLATQAYEDAALPIGHHQTISKPSVVARMIELAAAGRPLSNVLEIGTGCGYQAAVLSQVARDVYSIERIKPLYERAKTNLRPLRIPNIRLHYGDGRLGLPAAAPFDAIVIAAAGLDVPQALLEQLAIGGRLIAPVGAQDGQTQQVLTLVERTGPQQWRESRLDRVFFVPLKSGVI
ncbi:protein-L-isoaspartate(D-aspartate) O-methyltransferase [Paraburkholderia sp.]|uniref:protein-L-isoaspartate(D-aspartate) O-methyltransferase n=1 Tax=Paraburkholderia sp. TaxID=1926495 RepID=UPI00238DD59C|nr:protein-L-isoaspartate(D-aspartate) O-methyltransferase [Paraburkholderia sp.]MDE1184151.1 protein-L-isoaspartate(D-aspartate) O-methyltransferase [Paraburkholderia sp.]